MGIYKQLLNKIGGNACGEAAAMEGFSTASDVAGDDGDVLTWQREVA